MLGSSLLAAFGTFISSNTSDGKGESVKSPSLVCEHVVRALLRISDFVSDVVPNFVSDVAHVPKQPKELSVSSCRHVHNYNVYIILS